MNIILFKKASEAHSIDSRDKRAIHIQEVLKMGVGDSLFIGVIDGARGKATITHIGPEGIMLDIVWENTIPTLHPLALIVGLPRPQTARKILQECTSMGVQEICFFQSEKGEPSYAQSRLWQSEEWHHLLVRGAEQAFTTRIPRVEHYASLDDCLQAMDKANSKIALDLYEAHTLLQEQPMTSPCLIAIGSERGWSSQERQALRSAKYTFAHMGERVLRSETACIAASAIALAQMPTDSDQNIPPQQQ